MKYLIDEEKFKDLVPGYYGKSPKIYALTNSDMRIIYALIHCLVPYEEKKEIPSILYGNGCGGTKDTRCTKCNGTKIITYCKQDENGNIESMTRNKCYHCNSTGKEPRKDQDTRTHAWETPVSKQTYYSQDEVRKMLEDLKMRDNLAGNSKEIQEERKHMNAKIDKKIAEL